MSSTPLKRSPETDQFGRMFSGLAAGLADGGQAPLDDSWRALVRAQMRTPGPQQHDFVHDTEKRKVIRAGRRGGKTVGVSILALNALLDMGRILYATPTQEQIDRFWTEITMACSTAVAAGFLSKNETRHVIGVPGTEA